MTDESGDTPTARPRSGASHASDPEVAAPRPDGSRRNLAVLLAGIAIVVLLVGGALAAFVPQTVAEGGQGDEAWRLRVAPGLLAPSVRLEGGRGLQRTDDAGAGGTLIRTVVWQTGDGTPTRPSSDTAATIVIGPTPRGATSIRVTSIECGVGEAIVDRVRWRRMHLAVLPPDVWVTELVAIGPTGKVVDAVSGLPAPPAAPVGEPCARPGR